MNRGIARIFQGGGGGVNCVTPRVLMQVTEEVQSCKWSMQLPSIRKKIISQKVGGGGGGVTGIPGPPGHAPGEEDLVPVTFL